MNQLQTSFEWHAEQTSKYAQLGVVLLIGLSLRLMRLPFANVWPDEDITMGFLTELTLVETITQIPFLQPHPPLYYTTIKSLFLLFGQSLLVGRLFSVAVSTLSILGIYWIASNLWGHYTGLIAAMLTAWSPFHLYLSSSMRMYALTGLLSLCAVGTLLLYQSTAERRYLLATVVFSLLIVYTHWFGFFILGVVGMVLLYRLIRSPIREDIAAIVSLGLGSLPGLWLIYYRVFSPAQKALVEDSSVYSDHIPHMTHIIEPPQLVDVIGLLSRFATGRIFWVWEYALAVATLSLGLYGLYRTQRDAILLLWLLVPVLGAVAMSYLVFPVWRGRYLVIASWPVIILAAQGVRRLPKQYQPATVGVLLLLSSTTMWLFSFLIQI